jgi:hypothetical protein
LGGCRAKYSRRSRAINAGLLAGLTTLAVSACGGGGTRQDAAEPEGKFPVEITTAKFPNRQHLAKVTELKLGVKNVGDKAIPNFVVTMFVDPNADRPFNIRLDIAGAANPNRPVWVLEHGWPKLAGSTATAGAQTANFDTFQFGSLAPGDTREAVWRLSPVRGGTYTLNYRVGAGLSGRAQAVNQDGSVPSGRFLVRISTKPPKARISDSGKVVSAP